MIRVYTGKPLLSIGKRKKVSFPYVGSGSGGRHTFCGRAIHFHICHWEGSMEDRACLLGKYIAETGSTVRRAAQVFAISKSTAHKDVTVKLRREDRALYARVREVLEKNKAERHIRGGLATREKFLHREETPLSRP